MNQQQAISEFINSFCTIESISPPALPEVVPFDYTAYMTAKQIWVENIKDTSEESAQLRNKAQQLMKVLQYYILPDQDNSALNYHFKYKNSHTKKTNQNVRNDSTNEIQKYQQVGEHIQSAKQTKNIKQVQENDNKSSRKSNQIKIKQNKHQFVKSKQVQIKICRNSNKQSNNDQGKKSHDISQCGPYIRLVNKVKLTKYWDENIDNSNIQSQTFPKKQITKQQSNKYSIINQLASDFLTQYPQFNRKTIQNFSKPNKIVELSKMQYKKQIPKQQFFECIEKQKKQKKQKQEQQQKQKEKKSQLPQNIQNEKKCKGNCVYIKYECCCKCNQHNKAHIQDDSIYLTEQGRKSMRVNQFKLVSPSARESTYNNAINIEQVEPPAEKRVNARVQRVKIECARGEKLKTEGNYWANQAGHYLNNYQDQEQQEENVGKIIRNNENQIKMGMKNYALLQQPNTKHKRNNTRSFNEISKNRIQRQQYRSYEYQDAQSQKYSPQFQNKQLKVVQLNLNKKQHLYQRSKNQKQMLIEQQRKRKEQQDRQMKELVRLRQMQQIEQKKRENILLMKLRQQFSQICCQEPNEDQKRVSEQIKQLQIKLGQIVANNNRTNKICEPSSPKAKIVKLNLTPSRSNLLKNMPYFNKSTAPRSPVNGKSSRLLSKRVENASRVV